MRKLVKSKTLRGALALLFWLGVWQLLAQAVGREALLASPATAARKLVSLLGDAGFWRDLGNSFLHISSGFLGALLLAVPLALLALRFAPVRALLSPAMAAIRATPVASFILLAFLLFGSARLSVFISLLMALPVLYGNLLDGLRSAPPSQLEAAEVYGIGARTRLRYIYLPQAVPYFLSGCRVALGLAWKAGVAAEVIGLARFSLGERLYDAKLFLDTAEVFACTAAIVAVSALSEKLFLLLAKKLCRKLL